VSVHHWFENTRCSRAIACFTFKLTFLFDDQKALYYLVVILVNMYKAYIEAEDILIQL
jgi:hypothetical protein